MSAPARFVHAMPGIPFRKMHGLGNDFVVVDARANGIAFTQPQLERIADRRFGIGCDQLIVLEASARAHARMRIFNPDGGEVGACGNATRCIGWLLAHEDATDLVTIETMAGLLHARLIGDEVSVDMGLPQLDWAAIPLASETHTERVMLDLSGLDASLASEPRLPAWFSAVNMGNPHAIFFVEDVTAFDLPRIGPKLETHPIFPQKANISLVEVVDRHHLKQRVWERAAGITLACGTAACASAVAALRLGYCDGEIAVTLPGGMLRLSVNAEGHVIMTGPIATSFSGVISPSLLAGVE